MQNLQITNKTDFYAKIVCLNFPSSLPGIEMKIMITKKGKMLN